MSVIFTPCEQIKNTHRFDCNKTEEVKVIIHDEVRSRKTTEPNLHKNQVSEGNFVGYKI